MPKNNLGLKSVGLVVGLSFSQMLFASETTFNLYEVAVTAVGVDAQLAPIAASMFCLALLSVLGISYKRCVAQKLTSSYIGPAEKIGAVFFVETIMNFLYGLAKEQLHGEFKRFLPLLSTCFLFILICNLTGLIPGLPPPTENFSVNLAMGLLVFLIYHAAGISEHGPSYIKQFIGPFAVLAPLFLVLETISHCARPLSLAFRLTANIFADHLVLGVFSQLAPILAPSLLLFFGLLVACVQSFVFTLLASIYMSMAMSHDH